MTMRYGQNAMLELTRPANGRLVEELMAGAIIAPPIAPSNPLTLSGCGGLQRLEFAVHTVLLGTDTPCCVARLV